MKFAWIGGSIKSLVQYYNNIFVLILIPAAPTSFMWSNKYSFCLSPACPFCNAENMTVCLS